MGRNRAAAALLLDEFHSATLHSTPLSPWVRPSGFPQPLNLLTAGFRWSSLEAGGRYCVLALHSQNTYLARGPLDAEDANLVPPLRGS